MNPSAPPRAPGGDASVRRAVLCHELASPGSPEDDIRGLLDDGELRDRTTRWAVAERIDGLWCSLLLSHGITDQVAISAHLASQRLVLGCEATATQLCETLGAAGVDVRLVKGIAAANLDYEDPAQRSTVDVDAVVPREQLSAAIAALEAAGYRRSQPALRPGWERRFARTVVLVAPHGLEIDLHVAVATGYFGRRMPMHGLLAAGGELDLGGVRCGTLSPTARLVWSCYAAGLNRGTSGRYLRDAAQQLSVGGADWRSAVRLAAAGDGEAVLAAAATDAVEAGLLAADHPFAEWARGVHPSTRAAKALRLAAAGRTHGWSADARSTMLALGPLDTVRFLAEFVVPSPERRRIERRTMRERLRRIARFARMGR